MPYPYTNSLISNSVLASSMRPPQLPPFSGENQKGDVSFEVWKYELICIIGDAMYPNTLILQAIRRSLRGKAREILLTVDSTASPSDILSKLEGIYGIVVSRQVLLQQFYLETQHKGESVADYSIRIENLTVDSTASPSDILSKLEGIYGIVVSRQVLLQQFYLETQHKGESVADYSIRIENLLRRATVSTHLPEKERHEMLCSKLWNGLRDPLLKNSSRYKFDVTSDFNLLRMDLRQIEEDLVTSKHTTEETKQAQHNVLPNVQSSTDKKIDNLVEQMKSLRQKLNAMEKKYEDACKTEKETASGDDPASSGSFQSDYSSRGRGRSNYQRRGRSRGRGGSGRGFFNKKGSFQTEKNVSDKKQSENKETSQANKEN